MLILQQHRGHADESFISLKASKLSQDFCIKEELIMPVCLASLFLCSFEGSHSISRSLQPSRLNIISTMSMLSSSSALGGRSTSILTSALSSSNSDGFKPTSGFQVSGGSGSELALMSSNLDGPKCGARDCSYSFCCATLHLFHGWLQVRCFG